MIYGNYLREKYNNTAVKIADAEGVPCVMEYSKGKNLRNYEIYGNSVQDGTPSPDTPIEIQTVGDLVTDTASEYYGKYDVPITVRGKNLLPNSDWMSGAQSNGFTEQTNVDYITEYTQNSISFNLAAWKGVSSQIFRKDSVKRIVFKINQNQINSNDGYINFYIIIQGYDDNNNKVGSQAIYNNAIADTEYVFDFSAISISSFYANSTQFSFCILARKNALSNLMVYDIAYYADTDTTEYEPYIGETKHIYLNEPLRKVSDYADYIDFKNQKVMRQIEVLDDTGTKSIDESLDVVSPPAEESVSLPTLKTVKGTSIMSVDTTIQPSNIKTKYVKL